MADRIQINLKQKIRRSNLPEEKIIEENEKNRVRTAEYRRKKEANSANANDNEPPESVLPEDSVFEPPAACTPDLRDNADETTDTCTSSSSSYDLKRRKIMHQDDMKCVEDEIVQASKDYNFLQYTPQSDSSTMMTDQPQLLITSSITSSILTQPPPAEVRNVKY